MATDIVTTYQVSNRDGHHDFSDEADARTFAAKLSGSGWIGDTVKVTRVERDGAGVLVSQPEVIWTRTR